MWLPFATAPNTKLLSDADSVAVTVAEQHQANVLSLDEAPLLEQAPVPLTAMPVRRRLTEVSNWAQLQSACATSGTIELSSSFAMGSYTSECSFSGVAIVVRCNNNTLDANENGCFFVGEGSGSSLEVHGCVLTRGQAFVSVVLGVALRASC